MPGCANGSTPGLLTALDFGTVADLDRRQLGLLEVTGDIPGVVPNQGHDRTAGGDRVAAGESQVEDMAGHGGGDGGVFQVEAGAGQLALGLGQGGGGHPAIDARGLEMLGTDDLSPQVVAALGLVLAQLELGAASFQGRLGAIDQVLVTAGLDAKQRLAGLDRFTAPIGTTWRSVNGSGSSGATAVSARYVFELSLPASATGGAGSSVSLTLLFEARNITS